MKMTILAEFSAGQRFDEAVLEAVKFSKRNDCFVKFDFNGIPMTVCDIGADDTTTLLLYSKMLDAGLRAQSYLKDHLTLKDSFEQAHGLQPQSSAYNNDGERQ